MVLRVKNLIIFNKIYQNTMSFEKLIGFCSSHVLMMFVLLDAERNKIGCVL